MLAELLFAASEIGSTFFAEAGEYFGTPRHPWLGVSLFLISTFALGTLLSEVWRASGMV
jgi:hypothetical protein